MLGLAMYHAGYNVPIDTSLRDIHKKTKKVEAMKRKSKIFYHPIEGAAPLSVYWYPGPYGDAKESKEGNGVYFSSPNGELLGVQFDNVDESSDQQSLTTKYGHRIHVKVKAGKVNVKVETLPSRVA